VHGDHVDVTEAMNAYAEKKLQKAVGPFTDLLRYADVRLTVHGGNAGKGRREHRAEVTVHTKGRGIIRAEVRHEDMYASIDKAADKIQRQTRKLKERVKVKQGGVRTADVGAVGEDESFDDAPLALAHEPELPEEVARTKYFSLSPMSQADALQQLEYSDHDFWVYMDDRSQKIQVLYKRKAGGVGNLVPIMPEAENEA
jgi:putative sigma-54 modulation protein